MNMMELLKEHEKEAVSFGYIKENSKTVHFYGRRYFAFVFDEELRLFVFPPSKKEIESGKQCSKEYSKYSFSLSDILYFSREGDIYAETKITGGDGGGSNLGDAIIGGIIAGAPGAIIGSRGKTNPIKSETIKHDTRKTVLVCKDKKLSFASEDYSAFMQLIPDKELSVVQAKRAAEAAQPRIQSPSNRMRELKIMLDEGLITQEEFDSKRVEILKSV